LLIENFRGIDRMEIDLGIGNSAIFVGKNGAGKSSILECTAILLSRMTSLLTPFGEGRRLLTEGDIKFGKQKTESKITIDFYDTEKEWDISKSHISRINLKKNTSLKEMSNHIKDNLEQIKDFNLPLVAYYSVNRAVFDIPLRIRKKHDFNQLSTYDNSLSSGTDFKVFFEWYRRREDYENEIIARKDREFKDIQLESVRRAIYMFLPGFTNLRVERHPRLKMKISKNSITLEINQLSDGEKILLAMVGDLARRLAIANPGLQNPLEGNGIVLIDEIELHLHPKWQRSIISMLKVAFPNIQFLISTHSPQVIGESNEMSAFFLSCSKNNILAEQVQNVFGKDTNRILEEDMDVPYRNQRIKSRIEMLFSYIEEEDWEGYKKYLNDLFNDLGHLNDPEIIKAQVLFRRKRGV
jgi:predicted ATP-binding protein involved in virulence